MAEHLRALNQKRPDKPVPPELWAVIGCVALAGGLLLYLTLPAMPDLIEFLLASGPFESLGLFFAVFIVEIALLGVVLLLLAYTLYCGDPSARITTAVLCGAIGLSHALQGRQRTGTENWVMLLALAITATLALAPATREWFAAGADGEEPSAVSAARSISSVMAVGLGMVGLSLLPGVSFEIVFGLLSLGLCAASLVILRTLPGVRAGNVDARNVLSALMAGYVTLLLLARSEAGADGLLIPIGLAAAVIALLWLPPAARGYRHAGSRGRRLPPSTTCWASSPAPHSRGRTSSI